MGTLHSDEHLLAEMTAILGSHPAGFLRRPPRSQIFWDESGMSSFTRWMFSLQTTHNITGQWKGQVKIPNVSLDASEEYLEGENKRFFSEFCQENAAMGSRLPAVRQ
ncbi:uncharacterized protein N7459_006178 [Penicillium hispanicum]|uniref:uncharacterized protein n=1 Tax=Penicillium hispanicum TaxID=1080232 RepID=UPI0025402BA3|nr:uncharacterized protein N7459_006178 [Penicillium hispanicum]KAJ5580193.1 hypothetical protein N7459_006178 [Penicillium hispanicum]